jgi:Rhodopirellula transposase DDE domain
VLEVYWNGELLDSEEAVLGFAANMTYAGRHPQVDHVRAAYSSGVRRSSAEKKILEGRLVRLPSLPQWSVTIAPPEPGEIILPG